MTAPTPESIDRHLHDMRLDAVIERVCRAHAVLGRALDALASVNEAAPATQPDERTVGTSSLTQDRRNAILDSLADVGVEHRPEPFAFTVDRAVTITFPGGMALGSRTMRAGDTFTYNPGQARFS